MVGKRTEDFCVRPQKGKTMNAEILLELARKEADNWKEAAEHWREIARAQRAEEPEPDEERIDPDTVVELSEEETEKARRVFYQDKVFKTLTWIDLQLGRNVTEGQGTTVADFEESLAQVTERIRALGEMKQQAERAAAIGQQKSGQLAEDRRQANSVIATLRQRNESLEGENDRLSELVDKARRRENIARGELEAQKTISAERGLAAEALRSTLVDLCSVIEADDLMPKSLSYYATARKLVGLDDPGDTDAGPDETSKEEHRQKSLDQLDRMAKEAGLGPEDLVDDRVAPVPNPLDVPDSLQGGN